MKRVGFVPALFLLGLLLFASVVAVRAVVHDDDDDDDDDDKRGGGKSKSPSRNNNNNNKNNRSNCGTCDSLGYQCVSSSVEELDRCGSRIDPATCPIPSCDAYCRAVFNATGGTCNDESHRCLCAPAVVAVVTTPQPPPQPHAQQRSCLTCDVMRAQWHCIPPGTVDHCTRRLLPADFCGDAMPTCNVRCGTPGGRSQCAVNGLSCRCANGTQTNGATASTPTTTTTSTASSGAGQKLSAAKPIHANTAPAPRTTTLNPDDTLGVSEPVLIALIVVGSVFGLLFLAAIIYYAAAGCGGQRWLKSGGMYGAAMQPLTAKAKLGRSKSMRHTQSTDSIVYL